MNPAGRFTLAAGLALLVFGCVPARAQGLVHPDPALTYMFPAGARQGQSVEVEFGGVNGLTGASGIVVDGPPGVTARNVRAVGAGEVRATLDVAADAPTGRRFLRVSGGAAGLTNYRYFFVSRLPELRESEPNNTPDTAQAIGLPAVVNGRIAAALDEDCYRFEAKAGQHLVAAVLAQGMDSTLRGRNLGGFLDTSLELRDEHGKVVAGAADTLGLDPVLTYDVPAAGRFTLRVSSLGYQGSASAVYRLTVGEVPYPTALYPPGGRRGERVEVAVTGPNVPAGTHRTVSIGDSGSQPYQFVDLGELSPDGRDLPLIRGAATELLEREPNDTLGQATRLQADTTLNARLDRVGDVDWYCLHLAKGEGVSLAILSQRVLGASTDTLLGVYDGAGKQLAENDDGAFYAGQCEHEFASTDSWLSFTAPVEGDYFIRVSDQAGSFGSRSLYRLDVQPLTGDFRVYQWPDAVPVFGPGATAACVVQVERWGAPVGDIRLQIEGLPPGWVGSTGLLSAAGYVAPGGPIGQKVLLTLTAPPDAPVGAAVPFRLVATADVAGKHLRHEAEYLTLYGAAHNDRMHFRASPGAYVSVAAPLDCRIECATRELTASPSETVQIPVRLFRSDPTKPVSLTVDGETPAASSAWRSPLTVAAGVETVNIALDLRDRRPGTYGIVVARAWASDLRSGRPGPCSPLILLHIRP